MNLLIATDHYLPHPGGSVRVIAETARRLQARGHPISIVTFERDPRLVAQKSAGGVAVERVPLRGKLSTYPRAFVAGRAAVRTALQSKEHHLVHIHLPLIGLGAATSSTTAGLPYVYSFYGPWQREMAVELEGKSQSGATRPIYGLYASLLCGGLAWWQGRVMRQAARIVVLSEHSRREVATLFPSVDPARIVCIPGGVDIDRFQPAPDRSAARQRLGLPQERTVLFTVRRLVPRMGLENLLRAFASANAARNDLYLIIGGKGRLADDLARLARELGVAQAVRLTGYIPEEELPAYYQAADLFVLPTQALEGFGLITLEALASGLPVLATPVGATPEILSSFDARFLAQGADPAALARGIHDALDLIEREGTALRTRCRAWAVARYDWDRVVDGYEALYTAVVEQAREP